MTDWSGDRLTAARLWLISEPAAGVTTGHEPQPYLAHALYALVAVPSTQVARLSVDEAWRLYVNPTWLAAAPIPEIGRELAHEVWHLLSDHAERARSVGVDSGSRAAWESATHASISGLLDPAALRPDHLTTCADLRLSPGRSTEEHFAQLSRLPVVASRDEPDPAPLPVEAGCGSGSDGVPRRHELPPDADDVGGLDPAETAAVRRRVAIGYREHVTSQGLTPGDAWRWTDRILTPVVAWEPILAAAVRRATGWVSGRGDYTYARPSRRHAGGVSSGSVQVVLPGLRRPVSRVAVVVDTSASVDDVLLARALAEVQGALDSGGIGAEGISVLSCDAAVHTTARVRHARDLRLAGGGGTDLRVGIAAAVGLRPRPQIVVVLTDGFTRWPGEPPPGVAVVAGLLGRARTALPPTPPWIVRVECVDP